MVLIPQGIAEIRDLIIDIGKKGQNHYHCLPHPGRDRKGMHALCHFEKRKIASYWDHRRDYWQSGAAPWFKLEQEAPKCY